MNKDFEHWWNTEATFSIDTPKELCRIAWENGAYKAIKQISDGKIQEISHQYHYTYNPDYVGFARAILKEVVNNE